jgi:hypothetical protein
MCTVYIEQVHPHCFSWHLTSRIHGFIWEKKSPRKSKAVLKMKQVRGLTVADIKAIFVDP